MLSESTTVVPVQQRVKERFDALTQGQRKVAEYIVKNPERCAFSSAEQVGREVAVSQTTVIRLSYALGYGGFSDLQSAVQDELIAASGVRPTLTSEHHLTADFSFEDILGQDIAILNELKASLRTSDIWRVCDLLVQSDRVLVMGYRSSSSAARWLSFGLGEVRDDVHLSVDSVSETLKDVASLRSSSAAVVISFPRYTMDVIRMTEYIKDRGAQIVAVTDDELSPIARLANVTLTTKTNVSSGCNSMASVLSLLNLILAGISFRLKDTVQERRILLDSLYSRLQVTTD